MVIDFGEELNDSFEYGPVIWGQLLDQCLKSINPLQPLFIF